MCLHSSSKNCEKKTMQTIKLCKNVMQKHNVFIFKKNNLIIFRQMRGNNPETNTFLLF